MGVITRSIANNITTSGVFTSSAITNNSVTGITVLANASDGITLISSQTASNSASLSFTTGINSTYKAYKFVFVNIHPQTAYAEFMFNISTDGGSNYNVTKTTTAFYAVHGEAGDSGEIAYAPSFDLAQSTGFQFLAYKVGADSSDNNSCGDLTIFNPASTTYVKHFIAKSSTTDSDDSNYMWNLFTAGYGNTTSAVNAVQFKFDTGNIDDGKIYLYGIK